MRSMRRTNQLCSASSSASPSARIRAWHFGHAFQRVLGHSSPPTWKNGPGNRAATSSITSSSSANTASLPAQNDVLVDAPRPRDLERPARARELGVRGERGLGVAGHLDLGHHGHVPLGRVGDHVPHLVLRVEPAVPDPVERPADLRPPEPADQGSGPPRADVRQLGVPADLDPPALVLGEVPVEHVHPVERQRVDVLLHELHGEEVTARVEHQAAPGEPRMVDDLDAGNRPGALGGSPRKTRRQGLRWHELPQGGPRAERAGIAAGDDARRLPASRTAGTPRAAGPRDRCARSTAPSADPAGAIAREEMLQRSHSSRRAKPAGARGRSCGEATRRPVARQAAARYRRRRARRPRLHAPGAFVLYSRSPMVPREIAS